MKTTVIVLPTYNESGTIEKLIEEIFSISKTITRWEIHVLVVDSNSTDNTATLVEKMQKSFPRLHLLKTKKEGLGKAYIEGFEYALHHIKPYVLFEMDADYSHQPKYIPNFLEEIEKGADFVIGSRYMKNGAIPSNWGIHRKIFSIGANLVVKLGFMKPKISDWTNGFRAIKAWVIQSELNYLRHYSGYVFQIALLDRALTKNARIALTPIKFIDRVSGVSKINAAQYIMHTLWYVFTHSSFIKFVIVGFIGFFIDFSFAYLFIHTFHITKGLANMCSAEVAIISNFFLNNFWSFKHKNKSSGIFSFIKKILLFNLTSVGSILIQGIGMSLFLLVFGDHIIHISHFSIASWIPYKVIIIALFVIPYSYFIYNKFIWKDK